MMIQEVLLIGTNNEEEANTIPYNKMPTIKYKGMMHLEVYQL